MTAAIETRGLSRQYGATQALADCTLDVPAGRVAGLVGPNGAGKTTLLNLATGMLRPTAGSIRVLGGAPGSGTAQQRKVGFVAQETPVYAGLSVADHLRLGRHLNARWDARLAADRIGALKLDRRHKAGRLSGGQRAQLALTLALARRPELLILDEPVASLDPLARGDFLASLSEGTAGAQLSVLMSSHLVADLERICDYLVVLVAGRIQIAAPVPELLAAHYLVAGSAVASTALPAGAEIVHGTRALGETRLLVRGGPPPARPGLAVTRPDLEDIALAYMSRPGDSGADGPNVAGPALEATR